MPLRCSWQVLYPCRSSNPEVYTFHKSLLVQSLCGHFLIYFTCEWLSPFTDSTGDGSVSPSLKILTLVFYTLYKGVPAFFLCWQPFFFFFKFKCGCADAHARVFGLISLEECKWTRGFRLAILAAALS